MKKFLVVAALLSLVGALVVFNTPIKQTSKVAQETVASENLATKKAHNAVVGDNTAESKQSGSTPVAHDQLEFANSLQGTQIDGALKADADGNLVLNQGVRDFFDYFLSASDELGPENAILELQRYINSYLEPKAAEQALMLLGNYLRYKQYEMKLHSAPVSGGIVQDTDALILLRQNFDQLRAKRAELFNADELQALFGLEQSYQVFTISSLEVLADETIDDEVRRQRLNELQAALPEELRASQHADEQQRQTYDAMQEMREFEGDDSVYHQKLMEKGVTQEKADELVSYRTQNNLFDEIYSDYQKATASLDTESADYQTNLESLRNQFFVDPQQRTKAKLRDLDR